MVIDVAPRKRLLPVGKGASLTPEAGQNNARRGLFTACECASQLLEAREGACRKRWTDAQQVLMATRLLLRCKRCSMALILLQMLMAMRLLLRGWKRKADRTSQAFAPEA